MYLARRKQLNWTRGAFLASGRSMCPKKSFSSGGKPPRLWHMSFDDQSLNVRQNMLMYILLIFPHDKIYINCFIKNLIFMVLVKMVFHLGEVAHLPYKTVQGAHSGKGRTLAGALEPKQRALGGHSGPLDLSPGSKKHCSGEFWIEPVWWHIGSTNIGFQPNNEQCSIVWQGVALDKHASTHSQ